MEVFVIVLAALGIWQITKSVLLQKRAILVVLGVVACSSDGDDESATEKCERLVGITCDRAVECVPSSGSGQDCIDSARVNLPCGKATDVAQSYDECISDLRQISCAALFPTSSTAQVPANCEGVILFP